MSNRRSKKDIVRTETIHGHRISYYKTEVDGGVICEVPTYVTRVYSANHGLAGWQFRFVRTGQPKVEFYVGDHGRPVQTSLEEAKYKMRSELRSITPKKNSLLALTDKKKGLRRTGVPGIRVFWNFVKSHRGYQLMIEARTGAANRNGDIFRRHVGTEFSVTDEKLQAVFKECKEHRHQQVQMDVVLHGKAVRKTRAGNRKIGVSIEQVEALLKDTKQRQKEMLYDFISSRIPTSLTTKPKFYAWHGRRIKWSTMDVSGYELYVPDFITLESGTDWCTDISLPDGSVYGDLDPIGDRPDETLRECIVDALHIHMMATPRMVPDESVHGFMPEHAKLTRLAEQHEKKKKVVGTA